MRRLTQFTTCFTLIVCFINSALAQDNKPTDAQRPEVTVTAFATGERVRFTAPSSVVQIRLEVYDSASRKLFDNEVNGGNVLDWQLLDGQAERLKDGTYLCFVTVKALSGRVAQKIGSVIVEATAARLQAMDASQLSAQQSQAVGPVEEDSALTILREDEPRSGTVIAHNGEEGQISRNTGALSFRLGDFFSGKVTEQMRLTAEGNLGIGITHPQARLDVDGVIRASQGIVFPDGSIQYSAARKTFGAASLRSDQAGKNPSAGQEQFETQAAGTGTANRLAKWMDNSGTLGDSVISEQNGIALFGTTTQINPNHVVSIVAQPPKTPLTLAGGSGAMEFWKDMAGPGGLPTKAAAFGMATPGQASTDDMVFSSWNGASWSERMRMTNGGNLTVSGAINTNSQYNISGSRVLSVAGDNLFAGVNAGASNTTGNSNSFFGWLAGASTTTGSGNSFFGRLAGSATTTGIDNTLIGNVTHANVGVNNATAIGSRAVVTQSNSLVLGSINGVNGAQADTNVGIGTTAPAGSLDIAVNAGHVLLGHAGCGPGFTGLGFGSSLSGCTNYSLLGDGTDTMINRPSGGSIFFREGNNTQMSISHGGEVTIGGTGGTISLRKAGIEGSARIIVPTGYGLAFIEDNVARMAIYSGGNVEIHKSLRLDTLGVAGATPLCRNAASEIASCSSSLRYKDHVLNFEAGLNAIDRLRPVTFRWKESGQPDVGLVAEEVAKVEPLLVTYNGAGEVEGVKYDRISVLLLNAIKQQQEQIAVLQHQNAAMGARLKGLKHKVQQMAGERTTKSMR